MSRGQGQTAGGSAPPINRPQMARIGKRLRNLSVQFDALDLAINDLGEDRVAGPEWERAYTSGDPDDVWRTVQPITGGYEHIVQNIIELAKAAGRATGHLQGKRPRAEDAIKFLEDVGALSPAQRDLLDEHYVFRGRLSHDSPDITADDMALHAERALVELPPMVKPIRDWLAEQGITFPTTP